MLHRGLRERSAQIEAAHPGRGYKVTCSDYRAGGVLDADIITWWEQEPLVNVPALHHARREQVAGRLLLYWKEELKGGKTKICAVLTDGQTFQNVLTAEAWADADQAHAEKHLKPLLNQVLALENGKIASNGTTAVIHGKQIKLSQPVFCLIVWPRLRPRLP